MPVDHESSWKKVKLSLLRGWFWLCCSAVWCPHYCVSLVFFVCFSTSKKLITAALAACEWRFLMSGFRHFFFIYKYVCTHTNSVMESQVFIAKLPCRVFFVFVCLFFFYFLHTCCQASKKSLFLFSCQVKTKVSGQRSARDVVIKETMSCFDKLCLWLVQLFFPCHGTDETFWQAPSKGSRTPK